MAPKFVCLSLLCNRMSNWSSFTLGSWTNFPVPSQWRCQIGSETNFSLSFYVTANNKFSNARGAVFFNTHLYCNKKITSLRPFLIWNFFSRRFRIAEMSAPNIQFPKFGKPIEALKFKHLSVSFFSIYSRETTQHHHNWLNFGIQFCYH